MDPTTVKRAADSTLDYGVLGIIGVVFALAIVFLFRLFLKREDKRDAEHETMVKERASWELQEAKIRGECDAKIAAISDKYAQALREVHADAMKREDEIRRNFADMMDNVAAEASKSSAALVAMLQKFYDRFVGPTRRY